MSYEVIDSGQKWVKTNDKYDITYTFDDAFVTHNTAFNERIALDGNSVTGDSASIIWPDVFAVWEAVANIDFEPADSAAEAQLGLAQGVVSGGKGLGYRNPTDSPTITSGLSIIEANVENNLELLIHELGHILGLNHPGGGSGIDPAYNHVTADYTIMRYRDDADGMTAQEKVIHGRNIYTPMVYDIIAVQEKYGANWGHESSDSIYNLSDTTRANQALTIWDGGGVDNITAAGYAGDEGVRIDLREGVVVDDNSLTNNDLNDKISDIFTYVPDHSGLAGATSFNAFGAFIENATGSIKNDLLIGNDSIAAGTYSHLNTEGTNHSAFSGNNHLKGLGGNDTLIGGTGNDIMDGGDDEDTVSYADRTDLTVRITEQDTAPTAAPTGSSEEHDIIVDVEKLELASGENNVKITLSADLLLWQDANGNCQAPRIWSS